MSEKNKGKLDFSMKTVGKKVLWISTSEENPRSGEGTFLRLRDGAVLFAYTHFCGSAHDHGSAFLEARLSRDEGEHWSEPFLFLEKDPSAQNIMSPSLVRLADGDMGLVYLRKEKPEENTLYCVPIFRRSADEGKTWSAPVIMQSDKAYDCIVNDSVIVLPSGRLLAPVSRAGNGHYQYFGGDFCLLISDDGGATWQKTEPVTSPMRDSVGLQEPGVFAHENGELWAWFRTGYGYQYHSHSADGGKTWTAPVPNLLFSSPDSPMRVKRVGDRVISVFNPNPYRIFDRSTESWGSAKRTPLLCSISTDDGRSFDTTSKALSRGLIEPFVAQTFFLEADLADSYCYPAVIGVEDGFLVGYYHSAGSAFCLNCSKITKVRLDELQ